MWVAKPAVDIQLYVIKSTNQIAWEKRNHEVHEGEKKQTIKHHLIRFTKLKCFKHVFTYIRKYYDKLLFIFNFALKLFPFA